MRKLGFGFMRLPLKNADDVTSIDIDKTIEMVDAFVKKGFNYFDTAYGYHSGKSEGALRKAVVERYPRETFLIADKMPVWLVKSNEDYQKLFDEQRERLGTTYIDYYLLHALNKGTYESSVEHGGFEFIKKLKKEGLVHKIGFSFHDSSDVLARILEEQKDLDFVQLQINYADWESEKIESRVIYELAIKHNIEIIVMEPIKGGLLANVPKEAEELFKAYNPNASVASWAMRHSVSLPNTIIALSGMSTLEQVEDNIGYMENFVPINKEEQKIIEKVQEILAEVAIIPCTSCKYCIEDCPVKIPIDRILSMLNDTKKFARTPGQLNWYKVITENAGNGMASACIACGICEKTCPQKIEIIESLKDASSVFEVA